MAKLKISLKPAIRKLEIITKALVKSHFIGGYRSGFKGRGLEFTEYREYTPGEDASRIDWKASMRTNQLLMKSYEEERKLNVALLIDTSSSMVYGTTEKLKNEYAAEVAVSLGYAILEAGDHLGFITFSDKIKEKVYPEPGKKQFYLLSKALVNINSYGGGYDLANTLKFSLEFFKPFSLIIIISDFIGLKGNWERYLRIAAKKFDVVGIMIRDPRDKVLPETDTQLILEDPFTRKQIIIQPEKIKKAFRNHVKRNELYLKSLFEKTGSGFISLTTNEDFVNPILLFFKERIRKWR